MRVAVRHLVTRCLQQLGWSNELNSLLEYSKRALRPATT